MQISQHQIAQWEILVESIHHGRSLDFRGLSRNLHHRSIRQPSHFQHEGGPDEAFIPHHSHLNRRTVFSRAGDGNRTRDVQLDWIATENERASVYGVHSEGSKTPKMTDAVQ